MTIVLILQGLYGLFKAIRFIFVEFPIFEQALEDQHLGEETVNQFALQAGIMIFSTAVSMFFAVQMAIFHRKVIKTLNIIVGILVTIGSYYAMKYATSIDVLQLINLAPQRLLP